jgi:drug/metabolite transporter (DMT)-like permease
LGLSAVFWAIILPWWSFPFEILNKQIPLGGNFAESTWLGWFLILLIIIFGTIFPYLLTIAGLRKLSASTGSVIGMIEPVFAGIIAWIWLNESFNLIQLIGCAIVLFGIYLADKAKAH